jgi:hypothetical protein
MFVVLSINYISEDSNPTGHPFNKHLSRERINKRVFIDGYGAPLHFLSKHVFLVIILAEKLHKAKHKKMKSSKIYVPYISA